MSVVHSSTHEPGQAVRPHVTPETARKLVERLYGLRVKSVQELESFQDRNFLVMIHNDKLGNTCQTMATEDDCAGQYLLKILNFMDSETTHVDAEHQVLNLVLKEGFNVPVPVMNIHGRVFSREKIYTETSADEPVVLNNSTYPPKEAAHTVNIVRLMTFIPGIVFDKIPSTTARMYYDVGQFMGHFNRVTRGYNHPSLQTGSIWDMKNLSKLKEFNHAVTDETKQQLIGDVLKAFDEVVVPVMDQLPTGLTHGDCNGHNVIVKQRPNQKGAKTDGCDYYINGLIDFGDMRHTCYVFEVAITIMYLMLESNVVDPLEVGGHILAGYLTEMELGDLEWEVLRECVAARFATSLVMSAYCYQQAPCNQYLLVSAVRGWERLTMLWKTPKADLCKCWATIIESHRMR